MYRLACTGIDPDVEADQVKDQEGYRMLKGCIEKVEKEGITDTYTERNLKQRTRERERERERERKRERVNGAFTSIFKGLGE